MRRAPPHRPARRSGLRSRRGARRDREEALAARDRAGPAVRALRRGALERRRRAHAASRRSWRSRAATAPRWSPCPATRTTTARSTSSARGRQIMSAYDRVGVPYLGGRRQPRPHLAAGRAAGHGRADHARASRAAWPTTRRSSRTARTRSATPPNYKGIGPRARPPATPRAPRRTTSPTSARCAGSSSTTPAGGSSDCDSVQSPRVPRRPGQHHPARVPRAQRRRGPRRRARPCSWSCTCPPATRATRATSTPPRSPT